MFVIAGNIRKLTRKDAKTQNFLYAILRVRLCRSIYKRFR